MRFPASDSVLDDLFGFVDTVKTADFGGAGLFEVFVVVEMELDLFDEFLGEVVEGFVDVAVVAVVGGDGDDFVVDFAVVREFHDAEDAGFDDEAHWEWVVGDEEDVEFVAVFVESLRDEAVVGGLGEDFVFDAVECEIADFAVPFDLVIAADGDFDYDVGGAVFVVTCV